MKTILIKIFAWIKYQQMMRWVRNPIKTQEKVFRKLITKGANTVFGKDHSLHENMSYEEFAAHVAVQDYEGLREYFDRVKNGEKNILWPGKPLYLAKTSGTTSGAKYIPMTKDSTPHHVRTAMLATLNYIHQTSNADVLGGNIIFLQGSPVLEEQHSIKIGRLSGIVAHHVPSFLQRNRLPDMETNSIEDWETKVNAIVETTKNRDLRIIGGIPSWINGYFEKLQNSCNKPVGEIFKNFKLFVYGGVNYDPYREKIENLIGRSVDSIELFPASEGFFAFQDDQHDDGLLLQLNSGIFYEFIEADTFNTNNEKRIWLKDVKVGVNYVLILNTNAGLWGYNIGDTVMFTSTKPYKLKVTGRIKHFISAFGEHVIAHEVETAMKNAIQQTNARISEFTVAPQINPKEGLPYHEWCVEFDTEPSNMEEFARILDKSLQEQNSYYKDLIQGKVLRTAIVRSVPKGSFNNYMKSLGRFGGQNKIQRLSDNRDIVDNL